MKHARALSARFPLVAVLVLGACSTTSPAPSRSSVSEEREQRGREDLLRVQRALDSLPRCEAQDVAGAVAIGHVSPSQQGTEVRVRGFLAHGGSACNAALCVSAPGEAPSRCCNECGGGAWFVSAPRVQHSDAVVLDVRSPLTALGPQSMLDCAADALANELPLKEVVARGELLVLDAPEHGANPHRSWRVRVSQLCAFETPSAVLTGRDVAHAFLPR
ncbi:hypothetical protein P2318_32430 [Myxococcaceae bacterium GXIMD 01537]